jgi:hypothetical protein
MGWLQDFNLFIHDMFRHWVGKMTGALSIFLAAAPLVTPKFFEGDIGLVHNRWIWWGASALSFLIASRMAWGEQRKKHREAEEAIQELSAKLADRSPRVALDVMSPSSPSDWVALMDSVPPPLFYLTHYGGDGARDVRIGPIVSPKGTRILLFDPVNLISGPVRHFVPFRVALRDSKSGDESLRDGETLNKLLHFFLADNPDKAKSLTYSVPIEWQWNEQIVRETCELHFDTKRQKLSVHKPRRQ